MCAAATFGTYRVNDADYNFNSSPSAPAHFLSDEDQGNPGRNVVSDKKCAGAEGEELVL